jgi:hypothetical protein
MLYSSFMSSLIIPFPTELRPRLPTIVGNVDYSTLRLRLEQIHALLLDSGVEQQFVERALQGWMKAGKRPPTALQQQKFQLRSRRALRCMILLTLLQKDYRLFSCELAGNPLYQWFCCVDAMDVIQVPSKSELQRFAHWLPADQMREVMNGLLKSGFKESKKLQLKEALDLESYFMDTTCVGANIHFPVDWLLLRDGVITLMKATTLIRNQGLCARMEPPKEFLRRINRLSIEMTHQRRSPNSVKGRKRVLRQMKKVVGVVRAHAKRHRQLLDGDWQKTDWTRKEAEQVIQRIDRVLTLLPRAQKQAHERIIGGRQVDNDEKILSLHEPDIHVIVRGKANAEVEFGNTLLLGENAQGIILDYRLYQDQAPADAHLLFEGLIRPWEVFDRKVGGVGADRGFFSAANSRALNESETFNAVCPRKPQELKQRMKDKRFAAMQRRRSQTEARISILKRGFLVQAMRAKGFENRQLAVAWGVLTHDLWMFARLRKVKEEKQSLLQAA